MKLLPLTQGQFAKVDDDDFVRVNKLKWNARRIGNSFYAFHGHRDKLLGKDPYWGGSKVVTISLHRYILGVTKRNIHIDHKNGNGLDCRKSNMRTCTHRQNAKNKIKRKGGRNKYKGAYKVENSRLYLAKIFSDGKPYNLGKFKTAKKAGEAYDKAAKKYHGKFANLNFK